jgi:hypothetical protein
MALSSTIYLNQNICGCDGSVAINVFNGIPPYSYSIDGGVSFKNTPLFTNLCSGTYSVVVKDFSSNTTTDTITLNLPNNPIVYNVYLITKSNTIQNNGVTLTTNYETTFNVSPSLPNGVFITFDITHTNSNKTSPTTTASTITTNSTLIVDSLPILPTSTFTSTGTTFNPIPGCQIGTLYLETLTETWNSLSYSGSTDFLLSTSTSVVKNVDVDCYSSTSEEFYTISNINIYGCSCCSVSST